MGIGVVEAVVTRLLALLIHLRVLTRAVGVPTEQVEPTPASRPVLLSHNSPPLVSGKAMLPDIGERCIVYTYLQSFQESDVKSS